MSSSGLLGHIADAFRKKKRTSVMILAAGSGERFSKGNSSGTKKQFIEVLGVPALLRTARVFEASPLIDEIIIVTAGEDIPGCRELLEGEITKLTHIVPGGATRQESAMSGLEVVDPSSDYIAIHDGARCLITERTIEEVLTAAYEHGAAAAAQKAVDTVKYADGDGIIESTIDRDHVYLMKTPQVFLANMYRAAVYTAFRDGASVTDDCMLVERIGFKVKAVNCADENIKLTYATDKIIAEAILRHREESAK